jgi:hypothetical protein
MKTIFFDLDHMLSCESRLETVRLSGTNWGGKDKAHGCGFGNFTITAKHTSGGWFTQELHF